VAHEVSCAVSDYVKSKAKWERVSTPFVSPTSNIEPKCSASFATERMAYSNSSLVGNWSSVLAPFFVGFTRVFCPFKTRRLFISCYVLEVFLECVFGVVVLPVLVVGEWL